MVDKVTAGDSILSKRSPMAKVISTGVDAGKGVVVTFSLSKFLEGIRTDDIDSNDISNYVLAGFLLLLVLGSVIEMAIDAKNVHHLKNARDSVSLRAEVSPATSMVEGDEGERGIKATLLQSKAARMPLAFHAGAALHFSSQVANMLALSSVGYGYTKRSSGDTRDYLIGGGFAAAALAQLLDVVKASFAKDPLTAIFALVQCIGLGLTAEVFLDLISQDNFLDPMIVGTIGMGMVFVFGSVRGGNDIRRHHKRDARVSRDLDMVTGQSKLTVFIRRADGEKPVETSVAEDAGRGLGFTISRE